MSGKNFLLNNIDLIGSLTENLLDAIVLYNTSSDEARAVYANSQFYTLTGFSEDEVIGKKPVFSAYKEQNSDSYITVLNAIETGSFLDQEMPCLTKNGTPFWARLRSTLIKPENQSETYQLLVFRDITKRKKKEAELEKALANAESSKKIKDRFLANMSHEMRTPINGIMGMAQLLESSELNLQQKEYLEELKLSSENLLAIVNDILEFNFIESGALKLEGRAFNIRKQLSQLIDTIKNRAEEKKLSLDLVVSEKVPKEINGDVVRFSQILMNLIGNSIKFTKEGSVQIFVRALQEDNGQLPLEIKVKDTGVGIPKDLLGNIFESFNQASKITNYNYGGTGLGLSIVDQLVSRMGGTIQVDSKEGVGTEFVITIPFETVQSESKKPEKAESKNTSVKEISHQNNMFDGAKILVVDDYLINRKIIKGMLEKQGAEIVQAQTGEEALDLLMKDDFSMVLMDVHMPGMGGLETTRKIRELDDRSKRNLPIIAITASVLQRDIEECKHAGMNDFIAKPFTKKDLETTVKAYLENEKAHSATFDSIEENGQNQTVQIDVLMEMTGGDKTMVKEMIDLFIDQTPDMIGQLVNEFKNREFIAMSRTAHTLKPTFTYMEMTHAYSLAEELEELGKSPSPDIHVIGEKISELQKHCDHSVTQLKEVSKSLF